MDLLEQVVNSRFYIKKKLPSTVFTHNWEGSSIFSNSRVILRFLKQSDAEYEAQRLQEFKTNARRWLNFTHGGIEKILEVDTLQGYTYLAFEAIKGEPLAEYAKQPREIPLPEVLQIVIQIAKALAYLHSNSLVHKHLDPNNIWVLSNYDGVQGVKIAAYCQSEYESLTGKRFFASASKPFLAPAVLQNEPESTGCHSDIYSLGAILYWLLTGVPPPVVGGKQKPIGPPSAINKDIHPAIDRLVQKATNTGIGRRYQSITELLGEIIQISMNLDSLLREHGRFGIGEREMEGLTEPELAREPEVLKLLSRPEQQREKASKKEEAGRRRKPAASVQVQIKQLCALRPGPLNRPREINYFKQVFYNLFISRGGIVLLERNDGPDLSEKWRIIDYFTYFIRYHRGLIIPIAPNWKDKRCFLSHSLIGFILENMSILRDDGEETAAESFTRHFRSYRRVLLHLNPDIGTILPAERKKGGNPLEYSRRYLKKVFLALLDYLSNRNGPILLLVDKLQYLDAESLQQLNDAASALRGKPVLILGIYDPQE